jgi:hypothetical protein
MQHCYMGPAEAATSQTKFSIGTHAAGRAIVAIERPSPDRLSAGPLYTRTPRALRIVLLSVFMPYGGDNRIHAYSIKNPVFWSRLCAQL